MIIFICFTIRFKGSKLKLVRRFVDFVCDHQSLSCLACTAQPMVLYPIKISVS